MLSFYYEKGKASAVDASSTKLLVYFGVPLNENAFTC